MLQRYLRGLTPSHARVWPAVTAASSTAHSLGGYERDVPLVHPLPEAGAFHDRLSSTSFAGLFRQFGMLEAHTVIVGV